MNDHSESLLVHFRRLEKLKKDASRYFSLDLNGRQRCDLELLINRAYYPLTGYLERKDYETVLDTMRLANGTVWPKPICLDVTEETSKSLSPGQSVALRDEEGFMLAVLTVSEIWKSDKNREAIAVYGASSPTQLSSSRSDKKNRHSLEQHPGVCHLYEQVEEWYVSGSIEGLYLPDHYDFKEHYLTPSETHRRFFNNGWRHVIGFHTEDYMHCAHVEMVRRAAIDVGANIFLQPRVDYNGPEKLHHYTRIRCYQEIIGKFRKNAVMMGLLPNTPRWAGPREALWHAIIRKNFGCSHFLVADDHGDPFAGDEQQDLFYPRHAAQDLVKEMESDTGITMVPQRNMVYVEEKAQYIPESEVLPEMTHRDISPEVLQRRLENNLEIPVWFSYPEVVSELNSAFPPRSKQGFTIFFTGLSGSGKSTVAKVLLVKFLEMRDRPVTLLDGDIVRKNLSSELSFSKEHRNLNITRIGFVATEITKNGGIAICAPIAPYEESRRTNRAFISRYGGYIEIHVSTPLEICEQRDRKGLYVKARAGKIEDFTGISDPYVAPINPELTIDTSDISPEEASQEVLLYLEEQGYIR